MLDVNILSEAYAPLFIGYTVIDGNFSHVEMTAKDTAKLRRCCIQWRDYSTGEEGYWGPGGKSSEPQWYGKAGPMPPLRANVTAAKSPDGKQMLVSLEPEIIQLALTLGGGDLSRGITEGLRLLVNGEPLNSLTRSSLLAKGVMPIDSQRCKLTG